MIQSLHRLSNSLSCEIVVRSQNFRRQKPVLVTLHTSTVLNTKIRKLYTQKHWVYFGHLNRTFKILQDPTPRRKQLCG